MSVSELLEPECTTDLLPHSWIVHRQYNGFVLPVRAARCVYIILGTYYSGSCSSILVANVNHRSISCRTSSVLQWNLWCSSSVTGQWERGVAGHPSQVPPTMAAPLFQCCTRSCLWYMTMTDSCLASSLLMCLNQVFVTLKQNTFFTHEIKVNVCLMCWYDVCVWSRKFNPPPTLLSVLTFGAKKVVFAVAC